MILPFDTISNEWYHLIQQSDTVEPLERSMDKISLDTVLQAQHGEQNQMAALIACMMPYIRKVAAGNLVPGLEFEDAVQEGIVGLFQSVCTYQPDKNSSFEGYAVRCIRNEIVSARRAASGKKHEPLNYKLPLQEDSAVVADPEELVLEQEQLNDTLRQMNGGLSKLERQVLRRWLQGYDAQEIANQLCCSEKSVHNALFRLRKKIRTSR